MFHSLMMFFAPAEPPQAIALEPPAARVARRHIEGFLPVKNRIRFVVGVVANAIGFGALVGACWFTLQVMQAFLSA